jgi:hypothetical protein
VKEGTKPRLGIFSTYKTKTTKLTAEALRQRSIIIILGTAQNSPADRTRTALAQKIASKDKKIWKNIYSAIFRDLDEILIPLGLVEEEGRLPLKRGPKAIQEQGTPYYKLSQEGRLVSVSLLGIEEQGRILSEILSEESPEEKAIKEMLMKMEKFLPNFTHSLMKQYIIDYCEGGLESLFPFRYNSLKGIMGENMKIYREFLDGFGNMPKSERVSIVSFLDKIT